MLWVYSFFGLVLGCSAYVDPHCGGKQVIVQLFEWKWTDIAAECERFLGPRGFCGAQVSPPNEHAIVTKEYTRPWYEMYQPISYKLGSRCGSESEFKDMVSRCNAVGVRIYVDSIINHMAGLQRNGTGTAGTPYNSDTYEYPEVPYSKQHFHKYCPVNNYGDPKNVRDCFLIGLSDLDDSQDYVQDKIAGYLNSLVDIGVAGFRIDAAKHMWPEHLKSILSKVKDLPVGLGFPAGARPFVYNEVIDRNDGAVRVNEYYDVGLVTEFRYSQKIAWGSANFNELNSVVDYGWFMARADRAFVFVDNHDNQRAHGNEVVTFRTPLRYKLAVGFTLAYNYGFTRIMSSYYFDKNDFGRGPPHNADYSHKDVLIKPDGSCDNGWICEHRWTSIAAMVGFRNAVAGTDLKNWYNQNDVVAFSRGSKGFFLMSKTGFVDQTFQTGMAAGDYCDVIANCQRKIRVAADGTARITIYNADEPLVAIHEGAGPPFTGTTSKPLPSPSPSTSRLTHPSTPQTSTDKTPPTPTQSTHPPTTTLGGPWSPPTSETPQTPPTPTPTTPTTTSTLGGPWSPPTSTPPVPATTSVSGFRRTLVFMQLNTVPGQNLFFRGGDKSDKGIPIIHNKQGDGDHYREHNRLRTSDTTLDWGSGSPAVWTSNRPTSPGFTPLNKYGDHYWLMDVQMDCSVTEDGWFQLKGYMNGWEQSINPSACTGSAGGASPRPSFNHWGRCGYLNVFKFNENNCVVETIS